MGSISFDGTLPVCSCAYVNICGWKGALLKSFFCLNVWAGFCMCLSVYWRICQEHLRVTKKGKSQVKTERHQCFFFFFFFYTYPLCLLYICLFSLTTWSHFALADCSLHIIKPHLILQLSSAVNGSFFFLFRVARRNFFFHSYAVLCSQLLWMTVPRLPLFRKGVSRRRLNCSNTSSYHDVFQTDKSHCSKHNMTVAVYQGILYRTFVIQSQWVGG